MTMMPTTLSCIAMTCLRMSTDVEGCKGRNGHVPFRDSKLTRILQSSLGGNARTAIICTMSPARSHVEQSRNTLFFANCAKEVITNAQVNVVTSDRAMVKHLQRELARLESELRNPRSTFATSDCAALLREKDLQIEKLKKEIEDLTLQRDVAQSQLQDMLQLAGDDGNSLIRVGLGHYPKLRVMRSPESVNPFPEMSIWVDPPSPNVSVKTSGVSRFSEGKSGNISDDNYINLPDFEEKFLQNNTPSRLLISSTTSHFSESGSSQGLEEIDEQSNGSSEDLCKDVQCIETEVSCTKTQKEFNYQSPEESTEISSMIVAENGDGEDDGELVPPQVKEDRELVSLPVKVNNEVLSPPLEEDRELNYVHPFVVPSPEKKDISSSINSTLTKSRSCKASFMSSLSSSWFDKVENNETTPPNGSEKDFTGRPRDLQKKLSALNYQADMERLSTEGSQSSVMATFDIALEGHNWRTDITGVKETDEFQHDNQVAHSQAKGIEATVNESLKSVKNVGLDPIEDCPKSPSNWCLEFKRVQREIIELWHACNVSLVHRTYFFLLFKGDQTDYIYMEVELRRLSFIKDTFSRGHQTLQDGRTLTPASSMKAICRERRILSKQMRKRLSEEEREDLYHRWGVGLNTKNRRLQLAYRLWTHTQDMDHIADSAFLVAKLVGFVKDGKAPKEMFGLNFAPRRTTRTRTLKRSLISLSCNSHQLEIDTH